MVLRLAERVNLVGKHRVMKIERVSGEKRPGEFDRVF